ncbi:MAG: TonB-dependent receptor [Planctomycetes bacterium]|nr:TonB-dependent receptor [Planctomycetota bacterium]
MRGDDYSETTTDWSGRFMALYAMDEQQNHIVRAGFARSFRSPSVALREHNSSYLQPFGFSLFETDVPEGYEWNNEGTYSLEAGYAGQLSDNFSLNVDTYYQRMEDLAGARSSTNILGVTTSTLQNLCGANSWGAETSLTWQYKAVKLTGWYAYNGFETDEFAPKLRSTFPSQHKAGLSGRYILDNEWIFNANYAFQNGINAFGTVVKDPQTLHRLDLTLSRKFAKGTGEFMVGVSDVLNKTADAVYDSGNMTGLETPGRTFFTRLQFTF